MDGVVSLLFFFLRLYMSPSFFICFLDYIYLGAQKDGVSSGQWDIWDEPHGKLNLGLGFLIGLDWNGDLMDQASSQTDSLWELEFVLLYPRVTYFGFGSMIRISLLESELRRVRWYTTSAGLWIGGF